MKDKWKKCVQAVVVLSTVIGSFLTMQVSAGCAEPYRWMYTAPVRPRFNPCGEFFLRGDFLYWKAQEDGVFVALDLETPLQIFDQSDFDYSMYSGSFIDITLPDRKVKNFKFDWDCGFRIGLGYNHTCDGWDLALTWTHFNTTSSQEIEFETKESQFRAEEGDFGLLLDLTREFNHTDGNWRLGTNYIDLELGRETYLGKCLKVRPHIGGRFAQITQKYNVDSYSNWLFNVSEVVDSSIEPITTLFFSTDKDVEIRNDFCAAGIRVGFDTEWDLGCGVSIYGQAAYSLLVGDFDVKRKVDVDVFVGLDYVVDEKEGLSKKRNVDENGNDSYSKSYAAYIKRNEGKLKADQERIKTENDRELNLGEVPYDTLLDHFYDFTSQDCDSMKGASDLAIGLRWAQEFNCAHLMVDIGWEQHIFSGQNRFPRYLLLAPDKGGDLFLRGLTLSATLTF